MADALLNLGHIYLAQKKHPEALQMYQNYMKRVEDVATPTTSKSRVENLVDVLLYIAFAYFDWARHTELFNDMNAAPADGRYKMAMDHLVTALDKTVSKKEVVLRYNLCMTKLQAANCVLQKLTRNIPRTVEEVEEALQGLEASLSVVEVMLKEKEEGTRKISIKTSTLEDFLKHCRANIVSARSHLDDEKKRAKEEEAEREIRRLAAEAAVREASLKEAMRQAEEQKKQAERDLKAEAKMQKVAELRQGWEQEQAAQKQEKEKKLGKRTIWTTLLLMMNLMTTVMAFLAIQMMTDRKTTTIRRQIWRRIHLGRRRRRARRSYLVTVTMRTQIAAIVLYAVSLVRPSCLAIARMKQVIMKKRLALKGILQLLVVLVKSQLIGQPWIYLVKAEMTAKVVKS